MTQLTNPSYSFANDLLEAFFDPSFGLFEPTKKTTSARSSNRNILIDLEEGDDATVATLEVPGFKKDELDIQYEDRVLSVSGAVKDTEKNASGEPTQTLKKQFKKQVYIPDVQFDKASADLDHGILKIRLPKTEASKAQKLTIS